MRRLHMYNQCLTERQISRKSKTKKTSKAFIENNAYIKIELFKEILLFIGRC